MRCRLDPVAPGSAAGVGMTRAGRARAPAPPAPRRRLRSRPLRRKSARCGHLQPRSVGRAGGGGILASRSISSLPLAEFEHNLLFVRGASFGSSRSPINAHLRVSLLWFLISYTRAKS